MFLPVVSACDLRAAIEVGRGRIKLKRVVGQLAACDASLPQHQQADCEEGLPFGQAEQPRGRYALHSRSGQRSENLTSREASRMTKIGLARRSAAYMASTKPMSSQSIAPP